MDTDKFRAPTLPEALDAVRQRWGPKATILHVAKETKPGGILGRSQEWIEVTAMPPTNSSRLGGIIEENMPRSNGEEAAFNAPVLEQLTSLRQELSDFRGVMRQLERVQWARTQVENRPLKHPLMDFMIDRGLGSEYALELLADWTAKSPTLDLPRCIADMDRRLRRLEWKDLFPSNEGRCTLLLGLPGSGKTLLLIKIAARLRMAAPTAPGREQNSVILVSADMSRPGPSEELALYSEILQIPLIHIFNLSELQSVARESPPQTHILVDWNGISPYQAESWQPLETFKQYHPHPQMLLTASLASDLRNWQGFRDRFAALPLVGLALTQADLEHRLGKIWEAGRGTQLPIALISTGRNVPGDFCEGSRFAFGKHFFCDIPPTSLMA